MCGIYGYTGAKEEGLMELMGRRLHHRGPDDGGFYEEEGIGLGHRRLSIVDLEGGHQPFVNKEQNCWVVANGEIYNHVEIRKELEQKGHHFASQSDCEVILHLYKEKGLEFVKELNGMFAFAIWDLNKRTLILGRDRLGIRPLYYAKCADGLIFASEAKAIWASGQVEKDLNLEALDEYLSLRYVSGEKTFNSSVRRLLPGHLAIWRNQSFEMKQYWKLPKRRTSEEGELEASSDQFSSLLQDSVQMRLMSDVPVGLFVSGGVDSGLMTALVKEVSHRPIRTFSVGFGLGDDETREARELAREMGATHQEKCLLPEDLQQLPKIVSFLDEPIGDAIIIPTYCLGEMARDSVKVILTGEGADELFGGYVHHRTIWVLGKVLGKLPSRWVSSVLARWVGKIPIWLLDRVFHYPASVGREGRERLQSLLRNWEDPSKAFGHLGALFSEEEKKLLYTDELKARLNHEAYSKNRLTGYLKGVPREEALDVILEHEMRHWLPDYTLEKQDRLLMAHSLEGRVPYLDHRLVELFSGLPFSQKMRGMKDKYILRKTAQQKLPQKAASRKKKAFYFPMAGNFQHVFLSLVSQYLSREKVLERGLFRYEAIERLILRSKEGSLLYTKQLMALLILEIWLEVYHGAWYPGGRYESTTD